MFSLIFRFLFLNILLFTASFIHPRCFWKMKQNVDQDRVSEPGCVFSFGIVKWPVDKEYFINLLDMSIPTESYQFALAMVFSVDEVNQNPNLLPNVSLAFNMPGDDCKSASKIEGHLPLTDKMGLDPANYVCQEEIGCSVVLTGRKWATSVNFMTLLQIHKPQVFQFTYGPFNPILTDRDQFPYLYQTAPKDTTLALAMVSLMLHFHWYWVGLVISDDDQGIQFLSDLKREMEENTVCLAFMNMIPGNTHLYMSRAETYYNKVMTSSAKVVIIYGDTDNTVAVSFRLWESRGIQRIWLTTSQWDVTTSKRDFTLDPLHGTLAFEPHHADISGLRNFAQTLNPLKHPDEYLAMLEWMSFNCEGSISNCKTLRNCSPITSPEWLMLQTFDMAFSDGSYDVYNAVYVVAHVFHELHLQHKDSQSMDNGKKPDSECSKMNSLLRKIDFINPVGDRVNMNQKENLQTEYDIFHIGNLPHSLGFKAQIGKFSPYFPRGQQLHLSEDMMEWTTGSRQMPPSVCSVDCGPGFRKFWQEGMSFCCFDCKPCPENEISNETNLEHCVRCPEDHYANTEQNTCLPKAVIFLTYEDPLGVALTFMALCFSAFSAMVLMVFVKHQDTPIVKANNRSLSYVLLISLIFCFLCSLLFIGHPNSATCILQQITFGVAFTVAVSTVLAKTVTVVLAFKVTAPGRMMRGFLVSGAPNYIIPVCSIIQVILCTTWLGVSPPSVDIDAHTVHGQIIIVCNKGSVTAFYCVLGYLGSLALGSFTVAFLARNLPDTFNEAKLLTFSMLVFCSVWVTFLPVYHSTKGKVMVAVEVFSILASSAGLLGFIFVPKCYIILFRPYRNSLQKIREKAPS